MISQILANSFYLRTIRIYAKLLYIKEDLQTLIILATNRNWNRSIPKLQVD